MSSSFHSIGTMSSAIRAFQRELDVTGNNIANVNTQGYSRQRVNLKSQDAIPQTGNRLTFLGSGVSVASIDRARDMFLEGRRRTVTSDQSRAQTQADGLGNVEAALPTGTGGIGDALSKFYDAWSALSSNPGQASLKSQVQQAAQTLTNRLRSASKDLAGLRSDESTRINDSVQTLNGLAKDLSTLNTNIRKATALGGTPNELLDQRDETIKKMSELADVRTQTQSDGTVTVSLDQLTLVDKDGYREMATEPVDPVAGKVGGLSISSGSLRGSFDTINAIDSAQSRLDNLAKALRDGVNALHKTGKTNSGANAGDFLVGTGAADLDLAEGIKSSSANIATGTTSATGDGSLALSISRLRTQTSNTLGGRTVTDDFADLVAKVGRESKAASDGLDVQKSLSSQIDQQVQSVSGVSLDDEMANMLRFQRSYQAAAKALGTMDGLFDSVLSMLK